MGSSVTRVTTVASGGCAMFVPMCNVSSCDNLVVVAFALCFLSERVGAVSLASMVVSASTGVLDVSVGAAVAVVGAAVGSWSVGRCMCVMSGDFTTRVSYVGHVTSVSGSASRGSVGAGAGIETVVSYTSGTGVAGGTMSVATSWVSSGYLGCVSYVFVLAVSVHMSTLSVAVSCRVVVIRLGSSHSVGNSGVGSSRTMGPVSHTAVSRLARIKLCVVVLEVVRRRFGVALRFRWFVWLRFALWGWGLC